MFDDDSISSTLFSDLIREARPREYGTRVAAPRRRGRAKTASKEQLGKLLSFVDRESEVPEADRLKILLSFGSGLRVSEISNLKIFDVTESDGSGLLSTYTAFDGVPAGEYTVTVTWQEPRFDEENVAAAKIGQRPDEISRLLQRRSRRRPDVDAKLTGHQLGQRRLSQPGWSDERFAQDAAWVERDLTALKRLLEA